MNLSTVLVRWLLGATFIYTGLSKALHPVDFLKLVRQYDLVQSSLPLNSIAAALPWFEIFCGLLLLAGVAVRGVGFDADVDAGAVHGAGVPPRLPSNRCWAIAFCAVKFDCGCGTGAVFICQKLLENFLLILMSG